MSDPTLVYVLMGAALAGFVQGLSGFGFAVTALSLWAWVLEPRLAAALAVAGGFIGQLFSALTLRRGFDLKRLAPFLLGGLLGLPLGLLLLPRLDTTLFKAVVGGLLVLLGPLMLLTPRLPRITHGGRLADAAAGALGGAMGSLGGIAGVAPTLWCTLRGYPRDEQRAITQNFALAALGITLVSYMATGIVTPAMGPAIAMMVPVVVLPSLLGRRIYLGLGDAAFRRVVLGLITFSGAAMLVSALPVLAARSGAFG